MRCTLPESAFADRTFQLPVLICTAHFYLSDVTEDLCPTYIIPGSHKCGSKPDIGGETWNEYSPDIGFVQSRRCAVFPQ